MGKVIQFIKAVYLNRKLICELVAVLVADIQTAKDDFQKVIDKHSKGE
jgi:hypothetical protein